MKNTQKSRQKGSVAVSILAIVMALVLLLGVGYVGISAFAENTWNPMEWTWEWITGDESVEPSEDDNNGQIIEGTGVDLLCVYIPVEQYEDYGISPAALSAYQVTATVKDSVGETPDELQSVEYSMSWASEKSESVTDYVLMETQGMTATFSCNQAFEVKITVTCKSTYDPSKFATVSLDYAKRLESVTGELFGVDCTTNTSRGNSYTVQFPAEYGYVNHTSGDWTAQKLNWCQTMNWGVGTVSNGIQAIEYKITPTYTFRTAFAKYNTYGVTISEDGVTGHAGNMESMYAPKYDTVNSLYAGLTNVTQTELGTKGVYRAICLALQESPNALSVSITVTTTYGESYTGRYEVNAQCAANTVGSVETDKPSIMF